jgi:hypothetical protein
VKVGDLVKYVHGNQPRILGIIIGENQQPLGGRTFLIQRFSSQTVIALYPEQLEVISE